MSKARLISSGTALLLASAVAVGPSASMAQPAEKQEDKAGPPAGQGKQPSATQQGKQQPPAERQPSQNQSPAAKGASREGQGAQVPRKTSEPQKSPGKSGADERAQPSQEKRKQERSTQDQRARDKSQPNASDSKRNQGAAQQDGAGNTKQRPAEAQKDQSKERSNQRAGSKEPARQPQVKQEAGKTEPPKKGEAAKSATLTQEQRTTVRERFAGQKLQRKNRVNFSISVGTRIPRNTRLFVLPASVLAIVPAYRSYRYVYADDKITIVDPATYTIVEVIDYGAGGSTVAASGLELSAGQRKIVLSNVNLDDARSDVRFGLALGAEVPENVELRRFAPPVIDSIPRLEAFRYVVVDENVLVVDPRDRGIALVIRIRE